MPARVAVATHNLWLIPLPSCGWHLGRVERCASALAAAASELSAESGADGLTIVAVQEAWAYRVGLFWPILWLWSKLEALLLRGGLAQGGKEWAAMAVLKGVFLYSATVVTFFTQAWLPLLRGWLWDPKRTLASSLSSKGGLGWSSVESSSTFRQMAPWGWPACLMDSGLHTSASKPPDEGGFVGYGRQSLLGEGVCLKGMLWHRWGKLGVVNTHMTFEYADGGEERRRQQVALAGLVGVLLGLPPSDEALGCCDPACDLRHVPASSRACDAVLIM